MYDTQEIIHDRRKLFQVGCRFVIVRDNRTVSKMTVTPTNPKACNAKKRLRSKVLTFSAFGGGELPGGLSRAFIRKEDGDLRVLILGKSAKRAIGYNSTTREWCHQRAIVTGSDAQGSQT
jgi:hypothetical protein